MSDGHLEYFCSYCGWTIRDKRRGSRPVELVKLWREYNTTLDAQTYYCMNCAIVERGNASEFSAGKSVMIGDLVPACPTELPNDSGRFPKDTSFWGFTSTPDWSLKWWLDLPPKIPMAIDTSNFETREQTEERKTQELLDDEAWDEKMIRETEYLVEASHEQTHQMWLLWHSVLDLKQVGRGLMRHVGNVGKHEVWVTLFWYYIEGKLVGFYEGTSRVVDHELIKGWAEKTFACWKEGARCNMANFHHCLYAVAPKWMDDPKKKAQHDAIYRVLRA